MEPLKTRVVAPNFITEIIEQDLSSGKHAQIVTRFPPEPNGYLHIGHAIASTINFGLAQDYGGECRLRMDDTNPEAEKLEYVEAIERDMKWIGWNWGENLSYASNYFDELYAYAVTLIKKGLAYVESVSAEEMVRLRGTVEKAGTPSPYRDRTPAENLELFERMKNGEFARGEHVLRARMDLANNNMKLRDPVLYRVLGKAAPTGPARIVPAEHYRSGSKWSVYPSYDFAQALSDALDGVTHSLCSLEFVDNRAIYDWLLEHVWTGPERPHQYEFGRRSLEYTVVSKRKLRALVEGGHVNGWDDPRMPTLSGLRRRGVTPEAVRSFAGGVGVTRTNRTVELSALEFSVRDNLNGISPRVMAVLKPLKVTLTNYPQGQEEQLEVPYWPHDIPREGARAVPFSGQLLLEQTDFLENPPKGFHRLSLGGRVRLRYAYVIRCDEVIKGPDGEILELRCSFELDSLGQSSDVKGVVHWVSAESAVPLEVRLYERLFTVPNPDEGDGDFLEFLNPHSLETLHGFIEPSVLGDPLETRYQLERTGYFWRDPLDSREDKLVFNRIIGLRDTWDSEPKESVSTVQAEPKAQKDHSAPVALELTPEQNTILERLTHQGIGEEEARVLAREPQLLDYLEKAALSGDRATLARWVVNELGTALRSGEVQLKPAQLSALVQTVQDGSLSARSAKEVLLESLESGADPLEVIEARGLKQLSDTGALEAAVKDVLAANPDKLGAYRGGKKGLMGYFVGQVMKATGGQANPQVLAEVLGRMLEG